MGLHDLHGLAATVTSVKRLLLLAATVATFLAWSAPADASPFVRYGLQDDAWLVYGPGTLDERVADARPDRASTSCASPIDWHAIEKVRGTVRLGQRGRGPRSAP